MVISNATRVVGYARVSTQDQNTDLQIRALRSLGCTEIFEEKQSSVRYRLQLDVCLSSLRPGDVLVVYKLDRLARSLRQLLTILERLHLVGCAFKSATEPIDTATPAGRLMLQMLGAMAEFERSLIVERTVAGQSAAKSRGVHLGRKGLLSFSQKRSIYERYVSGRFTMSQLADLDQVSVSVVKRAVYSFSKPGYVS